MSRKAASLPHPLPHFTVREGDPAEPVVLVLLPSPGVDLAVLPSEDTLEVWVETGRQAGVS